MSSYVTKKTPGDTAWFAADRFGMFIHFGLYSLPARHEWIKTLELISEEKYDSYFRYFNPDLFDPREWAKRAKEAGMKYAVLTAKHHEGFCLFDSKYTDYKVTNTPYGKDIIREYVEAFRAEGLRVGLYYSLIDWHHPDFTIDQLHPRRCEPDAEERNKSKDMKKYAAYMRNQVAELLTNYGKIDILWFDYSYGDPVENTNLLEQQNWPKKWMRGKQKEAWESDELIALVRRLQPDIIVNNRTDIEQDIWTPEQRTPTSWPKHPETGELLPWELCQTFSGSWGYNRDEVSWKTPKMLIQMLINCVSFGGNLIMNVGPTARGCFDKRAEAALGVYGEWMHYNNRSIYNCTMAEPEFTAPSGCRLTQSADGKRLYVHLLEYPILEYPKTRLTLSGFAGKVAYAQFLHDASELLFSEQDEDLVLQLPHLQPNVVIPVVELFLK